MKFLKIILVVLIEFFITLCCQDYKEFNSTFSDLKVYNDSDVYDNKYFNGTHWITEKNITHKIRWNYFYNWTSNWTKTFTIPPSTG
ncbi:unnamed protein product [Chironomus riparius]|uniref:Uncharacterized protein n=1 Tax=Chironomus riparius TaxID=315576 RepID=A0A9N9RP17_9DIPT|nr:unnamed protein product [Chironomus riparius]